MSAEKKKRKWRWLIVLGVILAWIFLCPSIISERVLSRVALKKLNALDRNLTCESVDVKIAPWRKHFFEFAVRGRFLDNPFRAKFTMNLKPFSLKADGGGYASFVDGQDRPTPYALHFQYAATPRNWSAGAQIPPFAFSTSDAVLDSVLKTYATNVTDLAVSGNFGVDVSVVRTPKMPVPVWKAEVPLRLNDVKYVDPLQRELTLSGFATTVRVSGIADHWDLTPVNLRAGRLDFAGFTLSNLYATVQTSGDRLLVPEAGADVFGGKAQIYALRLDPTKLNAGFTLSLEGIEAAEVLRRVPKFKGDATGRMHGRVTLFFRNGKTIHLRNAYVYSYPGETGQIRMDNAESAAGLLAYAGLDEGAQQNVANALTGLDYSVLKFDIEREEANSAALSVKLEGSASRGTLTVPVVLNLTLHGDLEQLINTGLKLSGK